MSMSYQALYRRFRPMTFSEMVGQEQVVTILKNQVKAGRTAHAYVFAGTRGTGKTSAARILARAVNCLKPNGSDPCGKCAACLVTAGENPDIIELDAASNSGVDDIRDVIDKARYAPIFLRRKVYIIDEAQNLSPKAFDALLKTIEEPPEYVMFILATTAPQSIPSTIISRSQRLDFHRLTIEEMAGRMKDVFRDAGISMEEDAVLAIARAADGGMRDALSLADRCASFTEGTVTAGDVYSVLGSMGTDFLFKLADALIASDAKAALTLADRVSAEGYDVRLFVRDMLSHMRALMLSCIMGASPEAIGCSKEAAAKYAKQAGGTSLARIIRAVELLQSADVRMRDMYSPRILLESVLVRICTPEDEESLTAALDRLSALESRIAELEKGGIRYVSAPADDDTAPWDDGDPGPKEPPEPMQHDAPAVKAPPEIREAQSAAGGRDAKALFTKVMDEAKKADLFYAILAQGASPSIAGDTLVASVAAETLLKQLNNAAKKHVFDDAMEKVCPGMRFEFRHTAAADVADVIKARFGDIVSIEE